MPVGTLRSSGACGYVPVGQSLWHPGCHEEWPWLSPAVPGSPLQSLQTPPARHHESDVAQGAIISGLRPQPRDLGREEPPILCCVRTRVWPSTRPRDMSITMTGVDSSPKRGIFGGPTWTLSCSPHSADHTPCPALAT